MTSALAWIWLPALVVLTALGVGLLAGRLARHDLAPALLVPVGLGAAIVLVAAGYELGLTRTVVLPLLIAVAAAGLIAGRARLDELRPGPAGAAALGAFALYLAPVALSGHWTWPGYNFTNDPSLTFLGVDWIVHHGETFPVAPDSTSEIMAGGMVSNGYPLGSHLLLGTLTPLSGVPFAAAYAPFIALVVGLGAASMVHLARALEMPRVVAVGAAVTASGAALLYAYGQLGGLKEATTVMLLATAAAVAHSGLVARLDIGAAGIVALVLAALVPVLAAGGVAYAGVMAVAIAAAVLLSGERAPFRRIAAAAAIGIAVFAIASAPPLLDALRYGDEVSSNFAAEGGASTGEFGQLLRALPLGQAAGVWFAEDWRLPVAAGRRWDANRLLIAAIAALALLGLLLAVRRRSGLGVVAVTVAVVAAVLAPRLSPYADSKLMIVMTPFVLLLAAFGLTWLGRLGRPLAVGAGIAGAVIAAGVAYSDAIVYREVRLAPTERIEAIEDVAAAARGRGLTLFNEWEEYAKYFARAAQINVPGEIAGPFPIVLREPRPSFAQHFDLDEQTLAYVLRHRAIITRRGPATSRPPASYVRAHRNRFYELWVRRPGVRVSAHLPAQEPNAAQKLLPCGAIRRFARSARPGESLLAHRRAQPVVLPTATATRSAGWVAIGSIPGTIVPLTPGRAFATVAMPGGRYRAWIRGTSGRPIEALVDGRVVGALQHTNGPGQWVDVGDVTVAAGRHRLELVRGGGSLAPGDGYQGEIGPLALVPAAGAAAYVRVAPADAGRLCGTPLDWVERVSGDIPRTP
ncbi:MAG: Plug domain-containing protein [Solirubrobacteraceae bacterium]|nr:Plug domain-containing protein [Solirubrobacteraceae bacterium]